MPGNIDRVGDTFASQTTLPISSGQVDAEFNNLLAAADQAIDDINALEVDANALEVDATALTARVATIEGYDIDTRLDTLEADAAPTQHDIDTSARTAVMAGDAAPSVATMLSCDNIIIFPATNTAMTFTLPTPDSSMNLRTWRIVNAIYSVDVDFGPYREGNEVAGYSTALSDGGALVVMVLPSNSGGTGDYRYYILSYVA